MKNNQKKLSVLCELLFEANFKIYEYENKKWWGRKNKTATLKQINDWDKHSRKWNETRSSLKRNIDSILVAKFHGSRNLKSRSIDKSFVVLPISLMIDMLTIEHIKVHDLTEKGKLSEAKRSKNKIAELKRLVDSSIEQIRREGKYSVETEARTF